MRALLLALCVSASMMSSAAFADPTPIKPTAADLAKARSDLAATAYASALARFESGSATVEDVARWSIRWLDSTSDGATGKALTASLAAHAARMHDLADKTAAASKTGRSYASDADVASYYRIEADLWVVRGRR